MKKISVNNEIAYGKNSDDSLIRADKNDEILNANLDEDEMRK